MFTKETCLLKKQVSSQNLTKKELCHEWCPGEIMTFFHTCISKSTCERLLSQVVTKSINNARTKIENRVERTTKESQGALGS